MVETVSQDDLARRVAGLACWSGKVSVAPLDGGITNTNFKVVDGDRAYVVRLGGDIPMHLISRASELAASRAAHAAGVSPGVVHHEPGILVLDFIEGRTFGPEDIRDARRHPALIELIRRCHIGIPRHLRGAPPIFWVFQVLRDYAHTLAEGKSRHLALVPSLIAESEALEKAVGPVDIVFGHNDLLPANVLDDGRRLWLIDWDYAGFNSPLFDLGNLATNAELDEGATTGLLELYFGGPVDTDLRRRAAAMAAASLLRETMWGMVSEIHSALDFDYAAYTEENMRRYRAAQAALARL